MHKARMIDSPLVLLLQSVVMRFVSSLFLPLFSSLSLQTSFCLPPSWGPPLPLVVPIMGDTREHIHQQLHGPPHHGSNLSANTTTCKSTSNTRTGSGWGTHTTVQLSVTVDRPTAQHGTKGSLTQSTFACFDLHDIATMVTAYIGQFAGFQLQLPCVLL